MAAPSNVLGSKPNGVSVANPPKLHLQDLVTLERLTSQFNPATVEDVIHVEWVKQKVPGLSHRKLQYDYTDNQRFNLELIFDEFFSGPIGGLVDDAKKFIQSICYRKKDGQMSRVLVVWPNFFSLVMVVDGDVKTKTTRFNSEGAPTYVTITVPLTEIRDTRLNSEDVRNVGQYRSSSPGEVVDGVDFDGTSSSSGIA